MRGKAKEPPPPRIGDRRGMSSTSVRTTTTTTRRHDFFTTTQLLLLLLYTGLATVIEPTQAQCFNTGRSCQDTGCRLHGGVCNSVCVCVERQREAVEQQVQGQCYSKEGFDFDCRDCSATTRTTTMIPKMKMTQPQPLRFPLALFRNLIFDGGGCYAL